MSKKIGTEETGLSTRDQFSSELAPTSSAAEKQFEIQSAIIIANRFPRNEDVALVKLMKSCDRLTFAEDAEYEFPRAGTQIIGPSVHLARESARCWGNIRYGVDIIRDDENSRQIRGWAWDLETNIKVTSEDDFAKSIFRKNGGWIKPDERDLRELTNRKGAILERNCILKIIPKDFIEDARTRCNETIKKGITNDPETARKRLILAFSGIGVSPEMLETHLQHPIANSSPAEIEKLRKIYASIKDGNSTWQEYTSPPKREPDKGSIDLNDLKAGTEQNRGHGNDNLDQAKRQSDAEVKPALDTEDEKAGKAAEGAPTTPINSAPTAPISQAACSDDNYSKLVDTMTIAKEELPEKKYKDIIKNYTGPNRTTNELKDDEVLALIKSLSDAVAKAQK